MVTNQREWESKLTAAQAERNWWTQKLKELTSGYFGKIEREAIDALVRERNA